jgi:hypothetical protein
MHVTRTYNRRDLEKIFIRRFGEIEASNEFKTLPIQTRSKIAEFIKVEIPNTGFFRPSGKIESGWELTSVNHGTDLREQCSLAKRSAFYVAYVESGLDLKNIDQDIMFPLFGYEFLRQARTHAQESGRAEVFDAVCKIAAEMALEFAALKAKPLNAVDCGNAAGIFVAHLLTKDTGMPEMYSQYAKEVWSIHQRGYGLAYAARFGNANEFKHIFYIYCGGNVTERLLRDGSGTNERAFAA